MEQERNAALADITDRINRWADDPTDLDFRHVEALAKAVQRLEAQGRKGALLNQPAVADDLIVEEATPNRSG